MWSVRKIIFPKRAKIDAASACKCGNFMCTCSLKPRNKQSFPVPRDKLEHDIILGHPSWQTYRPISYLLAADPPLFQDLQAIVNMQ